ncbi:MAG: hypothetical protein ACYDH6_19805 [Acidimicrobiales bacterium]
MVRAEPRATIIFDTVYSNETDDLTSQYGSGSAQGEADAAGSFHSTWVLAPNVPTGPAKINVAASGREGIQNTSTSFTIKPLGESCP